MLTGDGALPAIFLVQLASFPLFNVRPEVEPLLLENVRVFQCCCSVRLIGP